MLVDLITEPGTLTVAVTMAFAFTTFMSVSALLIYISNKEGGFNE